MLHKTENKKKVTLNPVILSVSDRTSMNKMFGGEEKKYFLVK